MLSHLVRAAAVAAAALSAGAAVAQDYPSQPITVVVPYSAGGPTDTVARVIAQSMSQHLGQQVLVQNVGGAGGTVGSGQVAAAKPDGYTLLVHHIGMSAAPTMYRNLAFDALTDFTPIGLVTDAPMTIVGRPGLEADTIEELVAMIKAKGTEMTLAHGGNGGAAHLCGMLLQEALGVRMVTVPYQGTAPAMADLMGNQIDLMCDQTTTTVAPIQAGSVKGYAVTADERLTSLPELPTVVEAGLPNVQISVWHGMYGPAGLDDGVVATLQDAAKAALKDPAVIARLGEIATVPSPEADVTSAALQDKLSSQIKLWRPIIEKAGVYAN